MKPRGKRALPFKGGVPLVHFYGLLLWVSAAQDLSERQTASGLLFLGDSIKREITSMFLSLLFQSSPNQLTCYHLQLKTNLIHTHKQRFWYFQGFAEVSRQAIPASFIKGVPRGLKNGYLLIQNVTNFASNFLKN